MQRSTIDYGIDLGITNSLIALVEGSRTEIIKNNESTEFTPCAVWVDQSGKLISGRRAKERALFEPKNAVAEFRRELGTQKPFIFSASGKAMNPVELTAEILKSLKQDVYQRKHEEIHSAVITVPAYFDSAQVEATRRAAALAGLYNCPLLQEPVAAALAYGVQNKADNVFWLVYDFGGATFAAALVQQQGSLFRVISHKGDNHLGGQDLDWRIVEELMAPQVLEAHPLENFTRGNPRWQDAFAKMKIKAESMRMHLFLDEKTSEFIDGLIRDPYLDFEFELDQKDVARLAEPLIFRSILICKEVLKDARMDAAGVEKVILVGEMALAPYVRDSLANSDTGLGIPLEFSIDPMSVVARGAALYAGKVPLTEPSTEGLIMLEFGLEMRYQTPEGANAAAVGGTILSPEVIDFTGYFIEIKAASGSDFTSGRIPIGPGGDFQTTLTGVSENLNDYTVALFDASGNPRKVSPDSFSYLLVKEPTDPPLQHGIGIVVANNEVFWIVEKGQLLPARKVWAARTDRGVCQGEDCDVFSFALVEGSDERADLNRRIGHLRIRGQAIKRDLPAGSEVELTLSIDHRQVITTTAYIPFLNQELSEILDFSLIQAEENDLFKDLAAQKAKVAELLEPGRLVDEPEAAAKLAQIENEGQVGLIEGSLHRHNPDEAGRRLLELKRDLAAIEEQLAWTRLVKEAEIEMGVTRAAIEEIGDAAARQKLEILETEMRENLQAHEASPLRQKVAEAGGLRFQIISERPEFWIGYFFYLSEERRESYADQSRLQQLIRAGNRSILANNIEGVKRVVIDLVYLRTRQNDEKSWPPLPQPHSES